MDRGDPPLSSDVAVVITIQPANQNAPVFDSAPYKAAVAENSIVGTQVLTVQARYLCSSLITSSLVLKIFIHISLVF